MRRRFPSLRLCLVIMCLTILWSAAGAPLTPVEWQGIPDRLALMLRLIPLRMENVLFHWLPDVS